jgi:DNA-binding protein HU-beta
MTKTELIKIVAEKTGLSQVKTDDAIKAIFGAIADADETTIKSFGRFRWKTSAARKGRNPNTGLEMTIQESTTLKFKASEGLSRL